MEQNSNILIKDQFAHIILDFFSSLLKNNLPPKHEILSKSTILAAFGLENTQSIFIHLSSLFL